MKNNYLSLIIAFLLGALLAIGVIKYKYPCQFCSPSAFEANFQNSGNIPDNALDTYVWRVFHNSSGNFMIPYNAANIQPTVSGNTFTLTDDGQDCSYTGIGTYVKYNSSTHMTYMSSSNTISNDLNRQVNCVGPLDPTAGTFSSSNGLIIYQPTGGDTMQVGFISHFIWLNQTPNGIFVGFVQQTDITQ